MCMLAFVRAREFGCIECELYGRCERKFQNRETQSTGRSAIRFAVIQGPQAKCHHDLRPKVQSTWDLAIKCSPSCTHLNASQPPTAAATSKAATCMDGSASEGVHRWTCTLRGTALRCAVLRCAALHGSMCGTMHERARARVVVHARGCVRTAPPFMTPIPSFRPRICARDRANANERACMQTAGRRKGGQACACARARRRARPCMRVSFVWRGLLVNSCAAMYPGMRMDMCIDMSIEICIGMRIGMRIGMCSGMCIDMCIDMCTDVCMDMWIDMPGSRAPFVG